MISRPIVLRIGAIVALALLGALQPPRELSAQNLLPLPKVQELKLRNGLTVWLSEDHTRPIIAGNLTVRIGAKDSPNTGIPHYFEHIMFKGTRTMGTTNYEAEKVYLDSISNMYDRLSLAKGEQERGEIQKEINRLSLLAGEYAIPNEFSRLTAKYGGTGLNASTSFDYTTYYNVFSAQYLQQWCILNSERLINPVFRLFQSELETVYEEKNMYSDAMGADAMEALIDRFAAPHPYRYKVLGSTENLKNPKLSDMRAFFEEYYVAGNMGLMLTGDFQAKEILPLLEETFGRIRPGKPNRPQCSEPAPIRGVEEFRVKFPVPFFKAMALVWRGVPYHNKDRAALTLAVRLCSNEAGTGLLDSLVLTNKLMLATAQQFNFKDMGAVALVALPKIPFGGYGSTRKRLQDALERIREGRYPPELFTRLKKELRREHTLASETTEARTGLMSDLFAYEMSWQDYCHFVESIENLTPQDITRVATQYLGPNYLEVRKKTGRYPKDNLPKPDFVPVKPAKREAQSETAKRLEEIPEIRFPLPSLEGLIRAPVQHLNENPLVAFYPTPNPCNDIFSMKIRYRIGSLNLPAAAHLPTYLSLCGTDSLTAIEFRNALQDLGSSVSFDIQKYSFDINVQGFEGNESQTLALLEHFLFRLQPTKAPLAKINSLIKIERKTLKKSGTAIMEHCTDYALRGSKSHALMALAPRQIKKLKPQDYHKALAQILRTACEVHYVGNSPNTPLAETSYSTLHLDEVNAPGIVPGSQSWQLQQYAKSKIYFYNMPSARQCIIRSIATGVAAESIPPRSKTRANAALQLYNTYMGGNMNALLFQEIREYRSLAYSVNSVAGTPPPDVATSEGYMIAALSTQADKCEPALLLLDSLLRAAPSDPARHTEALEIMRGRVCNNAPNLRNRSSAVANYKAQGYTDDPGLQHLQEAEQITLEQLVEYHSTHIASHPIVYVIVGDKKKIDLEKLKHFAPIEELRLRDICP